LVYLPGKGKENLKTLDITFFQMRGSDEHCHNWGWFMKPAMACLAVDIADTCARECCNGCEVVL